MKLADSDTFYHEAYKRIYDEFDEGLEEEFVDAGARYIIHKLGIMSYIRNLRSIKFMYRSERTGEAGMPVTGILFKALVDGKPIDNDFNYNELIKTILRDILAEGEGIEKRYQEVLKPVSGTIGMILKSHEKGAMVDRIFPNYPAEQSGIMVGDIISHVENTDMTGKELTKAFFGPETCMWIDINSTIIDRLKYVKDTTDGVLGTSVQGIKIKKVLGNDLKDSATNIANQGYAGSSPKFGLPGLGDLDYDKWGDRNKVPIMVDGGTFGREWGIMTEDIIGRTFNSYIHTLHQQQAKSAMQPFVYQFSEQEPFRVKIRMERMFAPVIEDYASYVLLTNTVNRAART